MRRRWRMVCRALLNSGSRGWRVQIPVNQGINLFATKCGRSAWTVQVSFGWKKIYLSIYGRKILSGHGWALLERNRSGWRSRNKIGPFLVQFFCWSHYGDTPLFSELPIGSIAHSIKNWTGKRPCAPLVGFSLNGILFFFFFFSLFLFVACEQFKKGIVYPLAVKTHSVLDLVRQEECLPLS